MKINKITIIILTLIILAISVQAQSAESLAHRFNISMIYGGGSQASANHTFQVVMGEGIVGNTSTANHTYQVGYLTTILQNVTFIEGQVCIATWECSGWVINGTFEYRNCNQIGDLSCTNLSSLPDEVQVVSGYETAVALLYIFTVSLFAAFAYMIKDKEIKQVDISGNKQINEFVNVLLSSVKYLFIMILPAFGILGLHLASSIAENLSASQAVVNALSTAFRTTMGLYLFALMIFIIIVFKNAISAFYNVSTQPISTKSAFEGFEKKRENFMKRGRK